VHRDLKPANIMLPEGAAPAQDAGAAGTQGRPVLLDLGMGRKTDAEGKNILSKGDRLDAVAYYSPELTRVIGRVDGRTDMYSLAATLLSALTGQKPFTAPTHIELVRSIRYESPPALASLRPDVPPALAAAIARATGREAASRYGDMLEFSRALKDAVGQ
ncbi:MAG: serine/threonine protein kinase, partial [Planctomycetota bacterium]|nr:serine/threonine protein kinase [Planctomycetota bacterium]